MKKRETFSPPAVGGASLLVIFALLALSTFALLSLSTVRAEARLAETAVRGAEAYYGADLQAEEIFARLRRGERVPGVEESGGIYSYSCPISDHQQLMVAVSRRDGRWQILHWQVAAEAPESGEEMNVWDGNIP